MTRRLTPGRVDSQFQRAAHVNRHTPTRATLEHELELAHALANRARLSPVPFGASDTLPAEALSSRGRERYFLAGFSAFASALPSPFASIVAAVIVYSMVTLAPTLSSPVTFVSLVRATSHFSLPFCTTIFVSVTSRIGPVTW